MNDMTDSEVLRQILKAQKKTLWAGRIRNLILILTVAALVWGVYTLAPGFEKLAGETEGLVTGVTKLSAQVSEFTEKYGEDIGSAAKTVGEADTDAFTQAVNNLADALRNNPLGNVLASSYGE